MDDFCRISCGAPAESELLIKQFLMAKEALFSSFFGYNLHFSHHSPQNFLSGQAVWCPHHPWAQLAFVVQGGDRNANRKSSSIAG